MKYMRLQYEQEYANFAAVECAADGLDLTLVEGQVRMQLDFPSYELFVAYAKKRMAAYNWTIFDYYHGGTVVLGDAHPEIFAENHAISQALTEIWG